MKRTRTLASRFTLVFATSALAAASIVACNAGDLSLGEQGKSGHSDSGSDARTAPNPPNPADPDAGSCPAFAPPGDIGACTGEGLDCTFDMSHGCAHCICTGDHWICSASCAVPVPVEDAGDAGGTCNNGPSSPALLVCAPRSGCDAGATCDAGSGRPGTWTEAVASCGQGGSILSGSCGGYLAMSEPRGADGEYVYLYDATTKAYVATLSSANDQFWLCAGSPAISIDTTQCFHPDAYGFCAYGQSWTPCGTPPLTCPSTEPTLGQPCNKAGVCTYPSATICEISCDGTTWSAETPGCGVPPLDAGQTDAN